MTVILWFYDLRLLWNFFLEKLRELSSWTVRRSNQSILKEINPEYSLQGLILKLKIQYFGHLMWRANSLEKTLMLGKIEGKGRGERGRDGWMASLTQWTWVWANSGRVWRIEEPGMLQSMRSQRVRQDLVTEQENCLWSDFVWILSFALLFSLSSCPVLIHDFLELGSISKDLYIPIPDNFCTDLCKTGVFWVSETFFSRFQWAALD